MTDHRICPICGGAVPVGRGRPRRWCSSSCAATAADLQRALRNARAWLPVYIREARRDPGTWEQLRDETRADITRIERRLGLT